MPAAFYKKILYPLQDAVFPLLKDMPFYLTGGTALSRGYFNHRYSDDLDYFVNGREDFQQHAESLVEKLEKHFNGVKVILRDKHFLRVFVENDRLKIEMINDVPSHIGTLVKHPRLGVIDSKENILANKITALRDRTAPKDIADSYILLKDGLSIKKALTDADSKAAGIAPLFIAKILAEYDYSLLDSEIKWVTPIPSRTIARFMNNIAMAIVRGTI